MDERFTPTERRLGPQLDHVIARIGSAMDAKGVVPLQEIKEIFLVCARNGGEPPEECEPNIKEAFEILEHLSVRDKVVAQGINAAMMSLATALLGSVVESSTRVIGREMASLRGINARNKALGEAAERAREIAKELWQEDHQQKIRIGEMAQQVYAELHSQGMEKLLPKDPDAVRKWIRPVAPIHAMKPGRSRKSG